MHRLLCWEGSKPPGIDHTRAEAQTTCIRLFVCLFVCLFFWNETRKTVLRLLCWEGSKSKPPGSDHTGRGTNHMRTKDSGTHHVLVNLWITIYKLMGWLASLDSRQPYAKRILNHRKASTHALYGVLVLDGGRGKTMNVLVDSDRELPVNSVILQKARLHQTTNYTRIHTCAHTQKYKAKLEQNRRNVDLTLRC